MGWFCGRQPYLGMPHPLWPLFDLRVTTPRLELRYVDDELGVQLADLAALGVHDPATMPFFFPWTDVAPPQLQRNCLQYYWAERANTSPAAWTLLFAALVDGTVVGLTSIGAKDFNSNDSNSNNSATGRTFNTGSWLGQQHQGKGLGREMRLATLHLGFMGLQAEKAMTSAFDNNAPSLGVTRSLGYTQTGECEVSPRVVPQRSLEFELLRPEFISRFVDNQANQVDVQLHNVEPCLALLGL
jgi:RimJ/RimL family protein N-acetyltransferase